MLALVPKQPRMNVPKPEEFKEMRSTKDVDNFLWRVEQYFHTMGIEDDATKSSQIMAHGNNISYVQAHINGIPYIYSIWTSVKRCFKISSLNEKEPFYWFENGLKPWAKQELHRQRITELIVAMVEMKSFVELGPRKDKFESFKLKETANDGGNRGKNGNDNDGNGKNDGNGRPHNRDCPKKSAFSTIKGDDEPDRVSMRLNSIGPSIGAKRVRESKKKLVKCFLCCGSHRIRECPERSKISTFKKEELEPES
ncbi:hypothetical protein J1N35_043400 [Gossypium stocksii]|uniref:Retrotransposon gag domain-containing protein n=1 Tax=Gossypium stocksii TaxID=47602 RepID=A0A9D3U781_9ROSI|nr:hypothetical protein J1N35_043400 [Gossypium stocksii]